MLVLHHVTYSVNSLCHFFGRRRFDTGDESRNLAWLAPLSLGEAWHNNHHAFPTSAEHGLRRWELDLVGARDPRAGTSRTGLGRGARQPGAPGGQARDDADTVSRAAAPPGRCARRSRRRSLSAHFASSSGTAAACHRPTGREGRRSASARRARSPICCVRRVSSGLGRAYVSGEIEVSDIDAVLELLDTYTFPPLDARVKARLRGSRRASRCAALGAARSGGRAAPAWATPQPRA